MESPRDESRPTAAGPTPIVRPVDPAARMASTCLGEVLRLAGSGLLFLAITIAAMPLTQRDAPPGGPRPLWADPDVWWKVTLIGAAIGMAGAGLRSLGQRLKAPVWDEVVSTDHRPPILLLRSFSDDKPRVVGTRQADGGGGLPAGLEGIRNESVTFEQVVAETLGAYGPVVAIGRPGEILPPRGAARGLPYGKWQDTIEQTLAGCHLVVVVLGRLKLIEGPAGLVEDGLTWELRRVFALEPAKLMIVVPPVRDEEAAERWGIFRRVAGDKMPPYRGRELVLTFSPRWEPRVQRIGGTGHRLPVLDDYASALLEAYLLRQLDEGRPCITCGSGATRICHQCHRFVCDAHARALDGRTYCVADWEKKKPMSRRARWTTAGLLATAGAAAIVLAGWIFVGLGCLAFSVLIVLRLVTESKADATNAPADGAGTPHAPSNG
jgi:hypothetical protein